MARFPSPTYNVPYMSKRPSSWPCTLLALLISSSAFAGETVPIGEILAHPGSYHLRITPIQGTVRKVEVLKPHDPLQPGDPCYGSYVFELKDGTGSLELGVFGHSLNCNKPIEGDVPAVSIGDKVLVQAQILAPGHYIEKWRSPIPIDRSTIQAIAVKITHIGK